jgi:heptosyltransferase II
VPLPGVDRRGSGTAVAEPETSVAPSRQKSGESGASLVIQTSFLGDLVLTTPLIAELASRGPVDVVVTPAAAMLLANNPSIRDLIVYDKRGDDRGLFGLFNASRKLRARTAANGALEKRGTTVAYLAQGSVRSAILALLAGIRERVGFSTSAGRHLYTRVVPFRDDLHHAERLWRLAARSPDDTPAEAQLRPRIFPGDADVSAVDKLLRDVPRNGPPIIGLAPGSAWGTKRWPYYADLAKRLAGKYRIAIIGGMAEIPAAHAINDAVAPHVPVDSAGKLTLLGSAELIGRCGALVTNDSAPLHLASAMGTPTVALFGPTVPEFGFGPLAPRRAVGGVLDLPCRPCDRHGPQQCPLGHWRCMRELGVDDVVRLLDQVMAR